MFIKINNLKATSIEYCTMNTEIPRRRKGPDDLRIEIPDETSQGEIKEEKRSFFRKLLSCFGLCPPLGDCLRNVKETLRTHEAKEKIQMPKTPSEITEVAKTPVASPKGNKIIPIEETKSPETSEQTIQDPEIVPIESPVEENISEAANEILVHNLQVISKISPGQKLRVDYQGRLSIEESYFPGLMRTLTGNNKTVTMDRIEKTIEEARVFNRTSEVQKLFYEGVVVGLQNLLVTYRDSVIGERIEKLIKTLN